MAVVDPVFQSLLDDNTDTGGLEGLWRVQKLELVPVPKRLVRHEYELKMNQIFFQPTRAVL